MNNKYKAGQRVVFRPYVNLNPGVGFELSGTVTTTYIDGGQPAYTIVTDNNAYFSCVKEEDVKEDSSGQHIQ